MSYTAAQFVENNLSDLIEAGVITDASTEAATDYNLRNNPTMQPLIDIVVATRALGNTAREVIAELDAETPPNAQILGPPTP